MDKSVAIVGAGKMGLWFCNYFSRKNNYNVSLYDKRKFSLDVDLDLKIKGHRVTACKTLEQCVKNADIVIICVPIKTTISVINKCAKIMKKGACLVEITSVKTDIFKSLLKIPDSLTALSIHPMFGPGAKNICNTKILLIPIRNEVKEQKLVKSIFNESKVIVIKDSKYHDKLMATILGMVYYVNLLLATTLSKENIPLLKKFSGTTFYLQTLLFESILTDNSSLIASLLADNKELPTYLKKYNEESTELLNLITKDKGNLEKRISRIRKNYSNKKNINSSYEKMYSIISKLNTQK